MKDINSREVLALKYRPNRFEDLIGQDNISNTLMLALDTNRLSNAYLFSGLRGSGKTSTARIMAKALVCDNGPTSKPCEVCPNCISARKNKNIDIIEMDAASNRGIDDIKDLIEHTKYKPTNSKYKIFIIDEVHMLTQQAFNALLKTLEEPPAFVKFILATTDALKLPATILSRTQHFRFKRISEKNIVHHLRHILNQEFIEFETGALSILARAGAGSLRDTLTLLDQAIIFSKEIISVVTVTEMLGMIEPSFMEKIFDTIFNNKDIKDIVSFLEPYEVSQVLDEISIYLKEKMLLNDKRFNIDIYDKFFRTIANSKELLNMNSDDGFVLILTLLKMVNIVSSQENYKNIKALESTQKVDIIKENINISSKDNANMKFSKVISNIYSIDDKLAECFKVSFFFGSYSNNILHINSKAQGDCKSFLFKHFSKIKDFIRDVYGKDTQIEFNKVLQEKIKRDDNRIRATITQNKVIPQNDNQKGSMIEDIELKDDNLVLSQKEIDTNDILKSEMFNKTVQLFQPQNPPQIQDKL
ncbi:MAG: DNA polymerase III subunit gamma/tau [Campylobacterota bacterium]|nr:DNA polymerase III subunit gamma/tau [Campylobacterota bacterium]